MSSLYCFVMHSPYVQLLMFQCYFVQDSVFLMSVLKEIKVILGKKENNIEITMLFSNALARCSVP